MKACKNFLIAVALILVGAVGLIVCTVSFNSGEYKVMNKFISGVNSANKDKILSCMAMDDSQLADLSGESFTSTEILQSVLPSDAKEVKKVELIGCQIIEDDAQTDPLSGVMKNAYMIVKVTYVDDTDTKKSFVFDENVTLTKDNGGYKLVSSL